MKTLRFFIAILIALIVTLITLLIMAVYHTNYDPKDSMVFIESIGDETLKDGMGFVYKVEDDTNYILTNYHVVESSNYIYVYNLDNKKERASLVDFDAYTDIAILKIDDSLGLKEAKIGNSNIKVNDEVYYYNLNNKNIESGSVLNLDNEINISADYGNSYYNAVSVKANIENGNSGGALINDNDEVIGIISLKEENSDIGFYIPIDDAMDIVTKLENHTLIRPNLGGMFVSTTNVDVLSQYGIDIPSVSGVVIVEVAEGYPLNMAGLIKGDVINKINNVTIVDVIDMQKEIYSYNINDTVTLEYYRNNVFNTANIILNK